jgi:hypothetical protein
MKYLVGFIASLAIALGCAWLFWVPILSFLFSIIPQTASYAWVGKLICVVAVGYFGGIGIPVAILFLGIYLTIKLFE